MTRRVYRSTRDRMLGGVCGGLAEYFNVDPTIMRLLWVLLALVHGFGILAYIVAWIIIPELPPDEASRRDGRADTGAGPDLDVVPTAGGAPGDGGGVGAADSDDGESPTHEHEVEERGPTGHQPGDRPENRDPRNGSRLVAVILIILGAWFLMANLWPWVQAERFWPVILIAVGIFLLVGGRGSSR
ncbi:MAG: PspC domain-containing protein [Firmicutes bacterium]|nr:PspC domain-containing protein [Bacillota bacterium]